MMKDPEWWSVIDSLPASIPQHNEVYLSLLRKRRLVLAQLNVADQQRLKLQEEMRLLEADIRILSQWRPDNPTEEDVKRLADNLDFVLSVRDRGSFLIHNECDDAYEAADLMAGLDFDDPPF